MKVELPDVTIERQGVLRRQKATILCNAYSVKQLSANIYSYPHRAVLRELGCNAIDSHTMKGETRPFEVDLPSIFNPTLRIRDYGTGMSEDDVFNLYSQYFNSSKREDNSLIGAIGIGSKSVFAVTDICTVISYFEGKKYTYSLHMDEDLVPEVALLNVEETDETGFEVLIPVEEKDFAEFAEEAQNVYKFFDQPPLINGEPPNLPSVKGKYNGTNFSVGADLDQNYVVCGNIAYPVYLDSYSFPQSGIILFAPISAVSFTTSREQLQLDDKTRSFIQKATEELRNELQTFLLAELDKIETEWALAKFLNQRVSVSGTIFACLRNRYVKWKDKEIRLGDYSIALPKVEIKTVSNYQRSYAPASSIRPGKDDLYVDNLKKGGCARVKRAGGGKVLSLTHWRSLVKLLKRMGADPSDYTLTSTLEAPPQQNRTRYKAFRYRFMRTSKECWVHSKVPEECYFVYLDGYQLKLPYNQPPNSPRVRDLSRVLDKPLYGLRKTAKPPAGAINLCDYLKKLSEGSGPTEDCVKSWNYYMDDLHRWVKFAPEIQALYDEYVEVCKNPVRDELTKLARAFFPKLDEKYTTEYWRERLEAVRKDFDFMCFWDCGPKQYQVLSQLIKKS